MVYHALHHGRGSRVVVQAVVLRRDGAVLLSERSTLRGWELPGGGCKRGEDETAALRREVLEETGIEVRVLERVGRYRRRGFLSHEAWVYRCEVLGGELHGSRETPVVAWFPAAGLPASLFPWFRGPLRDALEGERDVLREETLGPEAVRAGMAIDLRTRLRGSEIADAIQSAGRR